MKLQLWVGPTVCTRLYIISMAVFRVHSALPQKKNKKNSEKPHFSLRKIKKGQEAYIYKFQGGWSRVAKRLTKEAEKKTQKKRTS